MAESEFSASRENVDLSTSQPSTSLGEITDDIKPATIQGCLGDKGQVGMWKGTYVHLKKIREVTVPEFPVSQVSSLIRELQSEVAYFKRVRHHNICQLFGMISKGDATEIVIELMHETLQHRISCGPGMAAPTQLHVIRSIARALDYLHDRASPIVYGCLTSGNVYISQDVLQVKIANVAIARTVESQTRVNPLESNPDVKVEESLLPTHKADVGALGLISAEVLSGRLFLQRRIPTEGLPLVGKLNEILERISRDHPLLSVIVRSLGKEASRPKASDFVDISSNALDVMKADTLTVKFADDRKFQDETAEAKHHGSDDVSFTAASQIIEDGDCSTLAGSEDMTGSTLSATVSRLEMDVRNLQSAVALLESKERKRNDEINSLRTILDRERDTSKVDHSTAPGQADGCIQFEENRNEVETADSEAKCVGDAMKDVYFVERLLISSQPRCDSNSLEVLSSLAKRSPPAESDDVWVTTRSGLLVNSESVLAVNNDFLFVGGRESDLMNIFDAYNLSLVKKSRTSLPCNWERKVNVKTDTETVPTKKKQEECHVRFPIHLHFGGVMEGLVCLEQFVLVTFVRGSKPFGFTRYLYSYDIDTDQWTLVSQTVTSVYQSQMVASGDTIFYIGGSDLTSSVLRRTDTVTTFDMKKREWGTLSPMPTARVAPSCAVYNDELYVAGGKTGHSFPWGRCNTCEVLSLETGTWRSILPTTMVGCAITAERMGTVVATGGVKRLVERSEPEDYIEIFDHRSSKWIALPKLPTAVAFHESCSTSDPGISIFCCGGFKKTSEQKQKWKGRQEVPQRSDGDTVANQDIFRFSCSL